MKKYFLIMLLGSVSLGFSGFKPVEVFAQSISLPTVSKTCLPEAGRMLRDRSASCHCPPESMCPRDMREWVLAPILPPNIAGICCDMPFQCSVTYQTTRTAGSGNSCTTNRNDNLPRFAPMCTRYVAQIVEDSQALDDIDYDPDLPENEEMALRNEAADAYNSCFTGTCQAIQNQFLATGQAASFAAFSACELSCKEEAAQVLSISLRDQERRLNGVAAAMSQGVPANQLFNALNNVSYPFNQNPPEGLPISALDSSLECGRTFAPAVCLAHVERRCTNQRTGDDARDEPCGSDCDCVAKDTAILMADGTMKPIQELNIGDSLRSKDGNTAKVAELYTRELQKMIMYSINDGELEITVEHPIMTTQGWRAVDYSKASKEVAERYRLEDVPQLVVGDKLVTATGEVEVKAMYELPRQAEQETYNLRLEGGDSFYANGILVKSN